MRTTWTLIEDVLMHTVVAKVQVTECPVVDCPDQPTLINSLVISDLPWETSILLLLVPFSNLLGDIREYMSASWGQINPQESVWNICAWKLTVALTYDVECKKP